jgi:hypothetical protein
MLFSVEKISRLMKAEEGKVVAVQRRDWLGARLAPRGR